MDQGWSFIELLYNTLHCLHLLHSITSGMKISKNNESDGTGKKPEMSYLYYQ
jgi:hypothetical protein